MVGHRRIQLLTDLVILSLQQLANRQIAHRVPHLALPIACSTQRDSGRSMATAWMESNGGGHCEADSEHARADHEAIAFQSSSLSECCSKDANCN